jgi:hypothetical protein
MSISVTDYLFGPPTSQKFNGVELGGSDAAAKISIKETKVDHRPLGAASPIAGFSRVIETAVSGIVTLNEFSLAKVQWLLHNITPVVGTAAATANGYSQVLAADAAAAASVIKFPGVALATSAEADDIVDTATAHGFTAGQRVKFESLTGGTGIVVGTTYFVIAANLAATTLQVSLTLAGAAATFTTDMTAGVLVPAYAAAEYLKIGDSGETELAIIQTVGTSGSGGTGITFTTPLIRAHDSGDAILQVADAGTTILQQRIGIIAEADHHDFVFQAVGPDGEPSVVTIFNALSDGNLEFELGETGPAGSVVTFTGYASKTDPTLAPWSWERLTP